MRLQHNQNIRQQLLLCLPRRPSLQPLPGHRRMLRLPKFGCDFLQPKNLPMRMHNFGIMQKQPILLERLPACGCKCAKMAKCKSNWHFNYQTCTCECPERCCQSGFVFDASACACRPVEVAKPACLLLCLPNYTLDSENCKCSPPPLVPSCDRVCLPGTSLDSSTCTCNRQICGKTCKKG